MAKAIRFFQLNTGAKIPSIGLGTWQCDPGVIANAVTAAIKAGYRHIDCAAVYGNENEIGTALKKLFDDGVVRRDELWITSKLCDHDPEDVPVALNRTLQDLQLDYVDLYLIQWPVSMKSGSFSNPKIPSTWRAMEALHHSGKARAIGASNFSPTMLEHLLSVARVPPAVGQVEGHPALQEPKLREFCKLKGIHLSVHSPLSYPGTGTTSNQVRMNTIFHIIAEKLGKTPAQVALRCGLQMGHSMLPKNTSEASIKEHFDVFNWSIPEDLMAKCSKTGQSTPTGDSGFVHETCGYSKPTEEHFGGDGDGDCSGGGGDGGFGGGGGFGGDSGGDGGGDF